AEMAEALESFLGEERGDQGARAAGAAAVGAAGTPSLAGAAAGVAAAGAVGAAGAAGAGAAGVAGAAGATSPPTVAAGVARPNPDARIDYPRDAYAGATPARRASAGARRPTVVDEEVDEQRSGAGPWLWVSAVAAIAVLALAGLFLSKILGGPGASGSPGAQVSVPNLIGKTFEGAQHAS